MRNYLSEKKFLANEKNLRVERFDNPKVPMIILEGEQTTSDFTPCHLEEVWD
jgi:hypothetical protein